MSGSLLDLDAPATRPSTQPPTNDAELLFREARQRRRRRWLASGLSLVAVMGITVIVALAGFGGLAPTNNSPGSGDGSRMSVPPPQGQNSTVHPVTLGKGPTSIYFANAELGWIATGCSSFCYQSSPAIVTTDNGGRTWRDLRTPNIGSVPSSGPTWFYLGGQSEVRFLGRQRGWYLQAGQLWTTGDGGSTWSLAKTGGLVTDLATAGDSSWILVSQCPSPFPLSCSELRPYHWTPENPTWVPAAKTFSFGDGNPTDTTLTPVGSSIYISSLGRQYRIAANGTVTSLSNTCSSIQGLTADQPVGLCNVGGAGDASVVMFAVSADQGRHWTPTVRGPPSHDWSGVAVSNGRGTIWYVVGGATLWQTTTSQKTWVPAYQTPVGSTDELYPVAFASRTTGYMGESGSAGVRLLKTTDGGLTWRTVPVL
jgi:photosystem II stability/assembly factor-like uncharacterized protein